MKRSLLEANLRLALTDDLPLLSVSEGIEALLGFTAADFVSARVLLMDRIHPDDSDIAATLFSPKEESESRAANLRIRHADGRIRCIRAEYSKTAAPARGQMVLDLRLQDAKSLGKRSGTKLLTAQLRAMMENTQDYIFFKDRNHVFTGASQTLVALTHPIEHWTDLLGKTDYDVFPEELADAYYRLEKQIFAGMAVAHEVQETLNKDGRKGWVNNRKYPILDRQGRIAGLWGIARDITERKQGEEALRESEAGLAASQARAHLGSWELDLTTMAGHWSAETSRLHYRDPLANTLSYAEFVELVHPEDRDRCREALCQIQESTAPIEFEYRSNPLFGPTRQLSVTAYTIHDDAGRPVRIEGTTLDITERKLSEAALRESEESLRESQRIAQLGSYTLDVRTGTWTSSESLDALLGIDENYARTIAGWTALIHPGDREGIVPIAEEVTTEGKPLEKEYRIVRNHDKAVRWVHTVSRSEFDAQGRLVKKIGTAQDITERKLTELALFENRELLQLFIEHAPAALSMFDREMRYLAASRRCLEEYGLAGQEIAGHSHYELFPWLPEHLKDSHRRALAGETVRCDEDRLEKPDGTISWVRWEVRPWRSADGAVGGIVLFTEDISVEKKAEAELRESKELLRLFVEHAPACLAMFDREMRFLSASRRYLEDLGIEAEDAIGRSFLELVPWLPEHLKELHSRALAGEAVRSNEERIERPDGSVRWKRAEMMPWRTGDGSLGGVILFTENITQQREAEAALRESKELLQLFIEHAPASLAMFDREMRYLAVSQCWIESYALTGKEVLGHSHYELFPEIPERWREAHRRGIAGETLRANEDPFERADGTVQWIKWEIRPWRTADGAVGGIVLFAEDVTAHRKAEERLQLAASVFTHAREGIFITDAGGNILDVNETFCRITGYTRDEVLGRNPRMLSSGFHNKGFYAEMWRTIKEKGQWTGEVWNRHKNGEIFAEMLTINALFDSNGYTRQYVALFSDITALKEHERKLEHIAHYDVLTGLPNRVLLADRLHQAMAHAHRRSQPLAVAFLDLDGFKAVNDRHGHSAGDQLLTALASRMKLALREGDTLARLGGDEFVAVLLDVGAVETSVQVLNRLLEAAAEATNVGDLVLQVSASIGVTFYPQSEEVDADQLLRQADQAMYQAKLAGRNRYHIFDSSQDRSVRGHHEDIALIRKALVERQFVMYYQPMVNMRTGAVVGAEALIRWQHPERGLLPPAMFLPVIEDHPLAVEIGEWVIDTALTQLERWKAAGLEIRVSVNVGALQLQQANFTDRLRAVLAAHPSIEPLHLELEVLETSALQDVVQVSNVINACSELGVTFALDDFGTGYSSLTYLKRLPARLLKIDRSFVRGILDDAEDLTIIEGVLGLATAFSRQAIAEGVETIEHGLILLQLGCELAQGYGIAHPMPANDLPGWAARWRPDVRWTTVAEVSPEDRPLLYAGVEHQAWVAATEAFLKGERRSAPPLDIHTCRFGLWLDEGGLAGRGSQPALGAVGRLHQELHSLGAELLLLRAQGRSSEGLARLDELRGLRDELLEHLKVLRQSS